MKRSTVIAVAVFGTLALLFIATRERQVAVGVQKLHVSPVLADAITEMSFGPIVLKSESGGWTVGNSDKRYPADEGQVRAAAQGLAELKAEDFVTDRTEKHADLEVDGAKGVTVTASTASGVVRELVLGKASRSGGAYVREVKSNAVFTHNGNLPSLAKRDLTSWRRKSIVTFKLDEVSRVTFGAWSLVSDSGTWKLEGETASDYRFDAAGAHQLVNQLANLSAQDFLEGAVDGPVRQVKAELKDGKSLTLRLGAKRPDGTYALSVEGDAQTYLLPGWQAEQLLKDPEGLRDLRLLRFDPSQVERFSLVANGKKTIVAKEGEAWELVEPKTAPEFDAQQVGPQLARLASMRGLKLVRDLVEPKSSIQLELRLKGGATQRLRLSDNHAKGDDGLVYTVNAGDKAWLETGEAIFKRPPPPPSGGIQGLDQLPPELRQQLEAQLRQQQR